MRTEEIIVGTDGTASSKAAVRWAAREAQRRNRLLRIVHAFDWQWQQTRYDVGTEYSDIARQVAEAVTAAALIGSTGLELLHHADCPVFIARPRLGPDPTS
jgi:nucleotide-binding universal stress UspA family protein